MYLVLPLSTRQICSADWEDWTWAGLLVFRTGRRVQTWRLLAVSTAQASMAAPVFPGLSACPSLPSARLRNGSCRIRSSRAQAWQCPGLFTPRKPWKHLFCTPRRFPSISPVFLVSIRHYHRGHTIWFLPFYKAHVGPQPPDGGNKNFQHLHSGSHPNEFWFL